MLALTRLAVQRLPVFRTHRLSSRPFGAVAAMGDKRKAVRIGTHNGSFHCDEALGCALLRRTEMFKDAEIVRSRDPAVLAEMDIVIDVGGVYDDATRRYDHHQREFTGVFGHGFDIKLSSAGLVYKHYGKEIVAKDLGLPQDNPTVHTIWLKVYELFMMAIDAIDNGISQWDTKDTPPRYLVKTDLSSRVGNLNPRWDEEDPPEVYDRQFQKAVELTGAEFSDALNYYAKSWLPARQYVLQALNERHAVHPSGEVLQLPRFCPWKEHLFELETELKVDPLPKYCLYSDQNGQWRVQAIPQSPSSFNSRRALPTAWRGVRDDALSELTGIPGCVFVHSAGFIGGNKTLEGAKEMASRGLRED